MDSNTKDILNRPFDRAQIRERKGPNGRVLSYVAIGDYIARLNEAFNEWSYEVSIAGHAACYAVTMRTTGFRATTTRWDRFTTKSDASGFARCIGGASGA
jgi:hypothetical protein